MASFTRRFRILKHLLAATEHQNAAMQLMLEDPDLDAAPDTPVDPAQRRKQMTERPTVMHAAFDGSTALAELERAHAAATASKSATQLRRVAEMADKLTSVGLIEEADARKFK